MYVRISQGEVSFVRRMPPYGLMDIQIRLVVIFWTHFKVRDIASS